ncbi:transglutaminase family protein [Martelella radicis]|uniref:Transglutaminase-like putative cysteine protease n=1 Tax=Martelella radicis TaxID=1397476 RepID=A0A7W6KME8_9HYPH|nr:transglutaminase family protein [Martelella radicis]MBB4124004.1 transglutaminase-like putative cysteine protease [Martelella radicis]
MLYDLSLKMEYRYDTPASLARHITRVMPLSIAGRQRLIAGHVKFDPEPDEERGFIDFFGHPAIATLVNQPHQRFAIMMKARVSIDAPRTMLEFATTLAELKGEYDRVLDLGRDSPHHFIGPSPRIPLDRKIGAYGRSLAAADSSVYAIARTICARVFEDFAYDGEATTVDSTPAEAFALRRGVCQDFSHVMISALRMIGIPAGYVSGYLRTIPPPGKPRLEGADAMHAWVRVWCGNATGWVEFDPTNNMEAGADHIVVGYGRDYGDVAPVLGMMKTYGEHQATQAVDVIPVQQPQTAQ